MANVIVSFWTENGRVMYDAISNSLQKMGNNVLFLGMHGYIKYKSWGGDYTIDKNDKDYLWEKINDFKPSLILSFNNIFPHEFASKLECPICVIDADTPNLGFWNKDLLKENKDRYIFLGLQKISEKFYKEAFGEIKNYLFWPPCTAMNNTHLKPEVNISFIGSNFLYLTYFVANYKFQTDKKLFSDILLAYNNLNGEFCNSFETFSKKFFPNKDSKYTKKIFDWFFYHNLSGMERIAYLDVLADLGLKIYGLDTWRELLYYNIELAKCFDDTQISDFNDNLQVYNNSKIAINISHKQAVSSFSWRVMDIMASGACLLMEDKPDWRELFEKYLSKETLDTVIYKDRYDMRQKAIKLLNNEELRLRCVADLNNAIEQNGRWEIRFKELELFTGIKLLNLNNKNQKTIFVYREEKCKNNTKSITRNLRLKNRFKIFIYSIFLALAQIPILDLMQNKKKRNKLREKIDKYWR